MLDRASPDASLPLDTFLSSAAEEIRRRGRRVIADVIEIGHLLSECRARLPHGQWLPWLQQEFAWSDRTALNFMRVYGLHCANPKLSARCAVMSGGGAQ